MLVFSANILLYLCCPPFFYYCIQFLFLDLNGFETLFNIGKAAGCKTFLQDLSSRLNVLKRLKNGMVVFCPNDAAYTQYIQKENVKYFSEKTLLFHTALAFDKERLMYRPIIGTGDVHITLDSQHNVSKNASCLLIFFYSPPSMLLFASFYSFILNLFTFFIFIFAFLFFINIIPHFYR